MKLVRITFCFEALSQLIDPFGHDQQGAIGLLGQEVAERPTDRAGQADDLSLFLYDRKLAINLANLLRIARRHNCSGLVITHVEDHVVGWIDQVDDPFYIGLVLHRHSPWLRKFHVHVHVHVDQ